MLSEYIKNSIMLNPGELYISTDRKKIRMILGTCVSVILYNRKKQTGAICHAQLGEKNKTGEVVCSDTCPNPCYKGSPDSNKYKYVTCAIRFMIESLNNIGISNNSIEAYIVGGASVIKNSNLGDEIASENVRIAEKMLHQMHIPVKIKNTGGETGRKLCFDMATGNLTVDFIVSMNN